MFESLARFLLSWIATSLACWAASRVFGGIRFADPESLALAALALGFVNAIVRPVLVFLTLPLTVVTLGLFLLVINAGMLYLASALVNGFTISDFWTALFASLFISVASYLIGGVLRVGSRAV